MNRFVSRITADPLSFIMDKNSRERINYDIECVTNRSLHPIFQLKVKYEFFHFGLSGIFLPYREKPQLKHDTPRILTSVEGHVRLSLIALTNSLFSYFYILN